MQYFIFKIEPLMVEPLFSFGLCFHLPCIFYGWVPILDFYLQGFSSFEFKVTPKEWGSYNHLPSCSCIPQMNGKV
jgi:hypothetical protein